MLLFCQFLNFDLHWILFFLFSSEKPSLPLQWTTKGFYQGYAVSHQLGLEYSSHRQSIRLLTGALKSQREKGTLGPAIIPPHSESPLLWVSGAPAGGHLPKGSCTSISLHSPFLGPWEASVIFNHHLVGLEAYSSVSTKEYCEPLFSLGKHADSPSWNKYPHTPRGNEH